MSLRRRRAPRYDVVFYTPWLGPVLSVSDPRPSGGAETQVLLLAQELAARGVSVALIVFGRAADLPPDVDGVEIVARPIYRKPDTPLRKLAEAIRIWRAVLRAPARTIVYRAAGFELALLGVHAKLTRRRLVYASASIADFDYMQLFSNAIAARMYALGVRLADAIVVQTEEQIQACQTAFGRRPTVIASLARVSHPRESPEAFLWIGTLRPYKRPLEYVALARALPDARFWMVGTSTSLLEADQRFAESVRVEAMQVPNLELLPPRPRPEIEKLIARAVAIVTTSEFEGMPNVLLEGWSHGVPALAFGYDPGGVIRAYGLGAIADGSRDTLVALARAHWTNRDRDDAVSRRCRAYVEEHHGPDVVVPQWLRVLRAPEPVIRTGDAPQSPPTSPDSRPLPTQAQTPRT
jgi:glycosyltransferase involved in cell wall biosynthesis